MKRSVTSIVLITAMFGFAGTSPPLQTVTSVDLERYLGKWYEIASYPAWFQEGCTATTAQYSLLPDGNIRVVNRCRKGRPDGPLKESKGKAEVVDAATNAKLKVWFFWPFKGDYWIIDLDPEYQWVVIGEPKRKYLWILSRMPQMDQATVDRLVGIAADLGFATDELIFVEQRE